MIDHGNELFKLAAKSQIDNCELLSLNDKIKLSV